LTSEEKNEAQAELFGNRLEKRARHLAKWARRTGVASYRLFDNDIPEIPLSCERFGLLSGETAVVLSLYERPYEKDEAEEELWLARMLREASARLGVPEARVYAKRRRRQRGIDQYEKSAVEGPSQGVDETEEGGLVFSLNFRDYLDTGLFLDHRIARSWVREAARDARVLNLFCYTGSFSAYAASGGARAVDSLDLSQTYLDWARRNMERNGFSGQQYRYLREDAIDYLGSGCTAGSYDLIVLDPPTFSNSKAMRADLDTPRDHPFLIRSCLRALAPGGLLLFSTNARKFKIDPGLAAMPGFRDRSEESIPEDFRDRKIHRLYEFRA
jgi:23S rRNA G2069 N7-methylase RlmK/C1962 C5-methylase RlmI